jgi:hypothetical protein
MANDSEEQDWDDFGEMIRKNKRGANDHWYWRDKPKMEAGVAQEVLRGAGCIIENLRSREEDPPDCEAVVDGKRSGIEVTELVHSGTLKSTIKGKAQYFLWDRDDLLKGLQGLIDRKDQADPRGGPYERYFLIIFTDEFVLGRHDVSRFLDGAEFHARLITDCFFGLSYDPSYEGGSYPIFRLTLSRDKEEFVKHVPPAAPR